MSDTPTAADLRLRAKMADAARFDHVGDELRASADAMDERDALIRGGKIMHDRDVAAREELARLRADRAALVMALRGLMKSDEGRGPSDDALANATAVLAERGAE